MTTVSVAPVLPTIREGEMTYDDRRRAVQAAISALINTGSADGETCYPWIRDLNSTDAWYDLDGVTWGVPYTIDAAGAVSVGAPQKVVATTVYTPVESAAAEVGMLRIASDVVALSEAAVASVGAEKPVPMKLIQPGWGSSGYYSAEMLKRDGPGAFPKGTHMFIDHPTAAEEKAKPERSVRDLGGALLADATWEDAGFDGPGLYAPVAPLGTVTRDTLKQLAPHIGVSIRAFGKASEGEADGRRGQIIEQLTKGLSVDFVTRAGAGGKIAELFESARSANAREAAVTALTAPKVVAILGIKETIKEMPDGKFCLFDGDTKVGVPGGYDSKEAAQAAWDKLQKPAESAAPAAPAAPASVLSEADRTELARFREAEAFRSAAAFAETAIASVELPAVVKARIVRDASRAAPVKDGKLDEAAYRTLLNERVREEAAYFASATGSGTVRGLGDTTVDEAKTSEAKLKEAFVAMGYAPEAAERMARG